MSSCFDGMFMDWRERMSCHCLVAGTVSSVHSVVSLFPPKDRHTSEWLRRVFEQ